MAFIWDSSRESSRLSGSGSVTRTHILHTDFLRIWTNLSGYLSTAEFHANSGKPVENFGVDSKQRSQTDNGGLYNNHRS